MTEKEELAMEIYAWQSSTQMYAPTWENLNEITKEKIRQAAALPTDERIKRGRRLTHREMNPTK